MALPHALATLAHARHVEVERALLIGAENRADALARGLHDLPVRLAALVLGERLAAERLVLRARLRHELTHLRGLRLVEAEAPDHVLHAALEARVGIACVHAVATVAARPLGERGGGAERRGEDEREEGEASEVTHGGLLRSFREPSSEPALTTVMNDAHLAKILR
jgi:hypothetical protein